MYQPPQTPRWRRYLRFWRPNVKADVDDEFQFHLQEHVDDLMAAGMDPRSARAEALQRFGNIEQLKDTCRELAQDQEDRMRRSELLGVLRQDALYALRLMRANPGFAAAVVLTLALGIGATTAIFSVVNSVLLRPLPYADSDRIVVLYERFGDGNGFVSVGHLHDWTEQTQSFSAVAAWSQRTYNLTDGEPQRILGARVTPSYFQVLSVPPALGRYFTPDETANSRVTVLTHALWQNRFAGDPAIVGKSITLDGEKFTVIGVAPAAYSLSEQNERLWTPLSFEPELRTNYGAHNLFVVAKLKPDVSVPLALQDILRVTEDIRRRQPQQMQSRSAIVLPLTDVIIGDQFRRQLWLLLSAVTLVLLIGCANVASLLLARASARRKEIAIRGALGGGRSRLLRQLLTESMVLALVGGGASLIVAFFGVRFLVRSGPSWVPRLGEAGLDPTVLLFALAATLVSALIFGLAPALRATRVDLQSELRVGGRGSGGLVRDRTRAALIVTEFAVALVLLVSAGLFLRSAVTLSRIPLGFDPSGITMLRVALPSDRYNEPLAVQTAFTRIVEQIRAIPGVRSAAAGTRVPMSGGSIDVGVWVDGRAPNRDRPDLGHVRMVTPGFIETMNIPVKRGRLITEADLVAGAPWVVVVNETFVRNIFGAENPIGKRISGWASPGNPQWREIVGVVGDVRSFGQANEFPPEIYIPISQTPDGAWNAFQRSMTIVAAAQPNATIGPALRKAVSSVDPLVPLYDMQTMQDVVEQSTATRRFNTTLLTLLGLTGLILAAIGIYGVIAFFVNQRTQEIGVRVALGASRARVVRLVVQHAVLLALLGITIGAVAAFWAMRVFRTMLFEVEARDPIAFIAAAVILLIVAVAAAWLPARRAARVDPTKALAASG